MAVHTRKIIGVLLILSGILTSAGVYNLDPSVSFPAEELSEQPAATQIPQKNCSEQKGNVQLFNYESAILHKPFYLRVYTPPCYDSSGKTNYPVLYMLHGQSFNDTQWDRLGLDEAADRLITSGEIAPLIIVLPQESAYLEDDKVSKYEEAVIEELMPWVEEHYPTQADRGHRAIGGLSRGAGWAMRVGLAHPELFVSIGLHSLAQFPGDYFDIPKWRKKTIDDNLPRIYMDIGLLDFVKDTAKKIEIRLSEYSYPHEWHLNKGSHNEYYWSSHVEEYLLWYSVGWNSRQ